jgi:hypothetical protein
MLARMVAEVKYPLVVIAAAESSVTIVTMFGSPLKLRNNDVIAI